MRRTRANRITDALVLTGLALLVVEVRHRHELAHIADLIVHARRDQRLGWG